MKIWLPTLLSVVFAVAGCRSTAPSNSSISSVPAIPNAEASTWRPVLFTDEPELQAGTGAMDAEIAQKLSKTDSGLRYRVLRKSNGKKPTAADTVTVNYRGWLSNGKVFDSSFERGEPTTFPLGNVVAGWTEGIQLIGEGGMIELWVPSNLGYGERGSPGSIPAHSDLHFVVELVGIENDGL